MRHNLRILLLYFGVIPFVLSILLIFLFEVLFVNLNFKIEVFIPLMMALGGTGAGLLAANSKHLPSQAGRRYLPAIIPLGYTAVLWAISMLISGGFYGSNVWGVYAFLQLPFIIISFLASFSGTTGGILFVMAPLCYQVAFLLCFYIKERSHKASVALRKLPQMAFISLLILTLGTGLIVQIQRNQSVLPSTGYGQKFESGYSSIDLSSYYVTNPHNTLPRLSKQPTFSIESRNDMLVLDGAEAVYPVYAAFALATYDQISSADTHDDFVTFTNTVYAFDRLLSREVDIYFGAQPSADQLSRAKEMDRELVMTPIGKEAFIFFVNHNNPIQGLQVSDIKDIYSGEIKNWREVGGLDEKIFAFQRNKNSGSQTLLEKIMEDTPLMAPLKEEIPRGMGGIIEQVADYRNYEHALGFSFRYYATGMNNLPGIKLLAIDDVEPTTANIANNAYPFIANLYAITLSDNPKHKVTPFLEWMLGPQGQQLVEDVGYVRLNSDY